MVVLALVGVVIGGLVVARPATHSDKRTRRLGEIVAMVAGLLALMNGWLNLAVASGGPGTGNGVSVAQRRLYLG